MLPGTAKVKSAKTHLQGASSDTGRRKRNTPSSIPSQVRLP